MVRSSLLKNLEYNATKSAITVLFETENSKELRIAMRENQVVQEHKTPYPIVVEIFNGEIDFSIAGNSYNLKTGDLIALEGNVLHDITAKTDSIIRLTLSKLDKIQRVKEIVK